MAGEKVTDPHLLLFVCISLFISFVSGLESDTSFKQIPAVFVVVSACKEKLFELFDKSTYDLFCCKSAPLTQIWDDF